MTNLQIRTANTSDIDGIMLVEKNGFIPQIQENKQVFLKRIEVCPQLFLVFFQKDDTGIDPCNKIAGYLSAEYIKEVPQTANEIALGHTPSSVQTNIIYLSSFSILPQFRGNGSGKKIWEQSLKFIKETTGCHNFILLVNDEWKGAKHIYEASGFRTEKIFKDFFQSEDGTFSDGILMTNF